MSKKKGDSISIESDNNSCNITQGDILRSVRELRGFTIKKVSKLTNISELTITNIENNKSNGSLQTFTKLSQFYGLSLEDLIFWTIPEENKDVQKAKDLLYNLFITAKAKKLEEN